MQSLTILRILKNLGPETYSESGLLSYGQTYSSIFKNDNFRFFTLILHINFNVRLSLLNEYAKTNLGKQIL